MANYNIEIERNNVTLAQFLRYVRQQCERKNIDFGVERDFFENPYRCESSSYMVVNGVKKSHFADYRQVKKLRRKFASYQTPEGYTRYYYTDEFEEYEETELCRYDHEEDGSDAPCKVETVSTFPYEFQTYILNHDGSMFNEICEFTFDEGNRGHGYYYQVNRDSKE